MAFARFANPGSFMRLAARAMPILALLAFIFFVGGLYFALLASPPDAKQGETVRIMYVHVPAAWISLCLYTAMAIAAGIGFVSRHTLTDVFCVATAPVGAVFAAICLITGSIWGKPSWGTWWVWDARLTSMLILFLLYCGYITLRHAFDDHSKGEKAGALLLLMGVVNIPIIHFSVEWFNTLHQPASILRRGGPSISSSMLYPLFTMALAYCFLAAYLIFLRMKTELIARKIENAKLLEMMSE